MTPQQNLSLQVVSLLRGLLIKTDMEHGKLATKDCHGGLKLGTANPNITIRSYNSTTNGLDGEATLPLLMTLQQQPKLTVSLPIP